MKALITVEHIRLTQSVRSLSTLTALMEDVRHQIASVVKQIFLWILKSLVEIGTKTLVRWASLIDVVFDGSSPYLVVSSPSFQSNGPIELQLKALLGCRDSAIVKRWIHIMWLAPFEAALVRKKVSQWIDFQLCVWELTKAFHKRTSSVCLGLSRVHSHMAEQLSERLKECFTQGAKVVTNRFLAAQISVLSDVSWKRLPVDVGGGSQEVSKVEEADGVIRAVLQGTNGWQKSIEYMTQTLLYRPSTQSCLDVTELSDFSFLSKTNRSLFDLCMEADKHCIRRVLATWDSHEGLFILRGLVCLGAVLQIRDLMEEIYDRLAPIKNQANRSRYLVEIVDKMVLQRLLEHIKNGWNSQEDPFVEPDRAAAVLNSIYLLQLELQDPILDGSLPTAPIALKSMHDKIVIIFAEEVLPSDVLKFNMMCVDYEYAECVVVSQKLAHLLEALCTPSAIQIVTLALSSLVQAFVTWVKNNRIGTSVNSRILAANLHTIADFFGRVSGNTALPITELLYVRDIVTLLCVDYAILEDIIAHTEPRGQATDLQIMQGIGLKRLPWIHSHDIIKAML
eukprot:Blabericola_migrator_1__10821@NODE_621_length_7226_cov_147_570331_g43_i1_p2_GENE_NODE_621_length_7226_cov_147_570331_g43_i1NODE_621_length_7226_cov_147_570331_g43_i1_p2_ORF_typecomplete_len565_score99_22RINT1_TIP1/PF04437_13/1_9e02RINT1_TIP1/PF04437_13/2RINT1_TIP1/PF04437_13/3_4_NODE_621_length_7226_cov_147_570331_g43_i14902184